MTIWSQTTYKALRARLRSCAGDTMIEVLSALLVVSLATMAMVTMVTSAVNIVSQNSTAMDAVYSAESSLAQVSTNQAKADDLGVIVTPNVNVTIVIPGDTLDVQLPVTVYTDTENTLACYSALGVSGNS